MLNKYLLSGCLIAAAFIVGSPAIAKKALPATDVAQIAKSTVVRIEPSVNAPGSGVIIGRYQEQGTNVYVVLTAGHVVQYQDDQYFVVTPPTEHNGRKRKQRLPVSPENIQKLPNTDLAIVKFRSKRNYEVATLGDSKFAVEGSGVYIAGFPNPGKTIKGRAFQFTNSLISSRLEDFDIDGETEKNGVDDGYSLVYTSTTRAGMSGGPVFDVAGRVVGTHGRGDREDVVIPVSIKTKIATQVISSEESGITNRSGIPQKTGFNLGIPVQVFLKLVPNAKQKLGVKVDESKPEVITLRGGEKPKPPKPGVIDINEEASVDIDDTTSENREISKPSQPATSVTSPVRSNPVTAPSVKPPSRSRVW